MWEPRQVVGRREVERKPSGSCRSIMALGWEWPRLLPWLPKASSGSVSPGCPAGRICIASCPLPLDVLAILLTDVLLLLQEKDQKYVFASVVCVLYSHQELL